MVPIDLLDAFLSFGDIIRGALHGVRDIFLFDMRGGFFETGFPDETEARKAMRLMSRDFVYSAFDKAGMASMARLYPNELVWALAALLGLIVGAVILCLRLIMQPCCDRASAPAVSSDEYDDNYFWRNAADARRAEELKRRPPQPES
jgi:hypothetical protein